jgi:hypothetical protein
MLTCRPAPHLASQLGSSTIALLILHSPGGLLRLPILLCMQPRCHWCAMWLLIHGCQLHNTCRRLHPCRFSLEHGLPASAGRRCCILLCYVRCPLGRL